MVCDEDCRTLQGRVLRERNNKPIKLPLKKLIIATRDADFLSQVVDGPLCEYVKDELNLRDIEACQDPSHYSALRGEPNYPVLGKRLGKQMSSVAKAIKSLPSEQLEAFENGESIELEGNTLSGDDIRIHREFKVPEGRAKDDLDATNDGDILVVLELGVDDSLLEDGLARELSAHVSKLRKKSGLVPQDRVELYYEVIRSAGEGQSASIEGVLSRNPGQGPSLVEHRVGVLPLPMFRLPPHAVQHGEEELTLSDGSSVKVVLCRPSVAVIESRLFEALGGDESAIEAARLFLHSRSLSGLDPDGSVSFHANGKDARLYAGYHFFFSLPDAIASGALA